MQISNVLAGYPDLGTLAKPAEAVEAAGVGGLKAAEGHASPAAGKAKAMAQILSRYDVTDISATQFSQMIQKLFEAGVLSEKELQQLAAVRTDLEAEGVGADESIDLLEFYARKIKKLQNRLSDSEASAAEQQQLAPLLGRLDWLQKFALIQSTPDSIGLDALV